MRLTVNHVTTYTYDQPVRAVVQSHRLEPTLCQSQTVIDWRVLDSDGTKGGGFRDGAAQSPGVDKGQFVAGAPGGGEDRIVFHFYSRYR